MLSHFPEEVSYIRPRDPSIQNFNRMNLKRVNLQYTDESTIHPEVAVEDLDECLEGSYIPIYLVLKSNLKEDDYKIHQNKFTYRSVSERKEAIYKQITFSKIFGVNDQQDKIFKEVVKLKVFEFLNGKNSTIFTYGGPGAGRSYTTIGTKKDPGLLPRSLEYIFKTLPKLPDAPIIKPTPQGEIIRLDPKQRKLEAIIKTSTLKKQKTVDRLENATLYQSMQEQLKHETCAFLEELSEVTIAVFVSFIEICNEEIYDVLERNVSERGGRKKLHLGTINGKPYLNELTYLNVSNAIEVFQIYQYGMQKLKTTKILSHSIFTIWMASAKSNCETTFLSAFNICNLASTDEVGTNNSGLHCKQRNSINNSLMVLGKCINKLEDSAKNPNIKNIIPYRESKLSLLFQRALQGMEDFCIFINIDPSKEAYTQTLSVLNFSALIKSVIPKEEFMNINDGSQNKSPNLVNVSELEDELKLLKEALMETKSNYEDLKKNRSNNIELEKQDFKKSVEGIYQDVEKIFQTKKKNLEDKLEQEFSKELSAMKNNMQKKLKKKLKKEKQNESKKFKTEYEKNNITLTRLRNCCTESEEKLEKIKNLVFEIESRKKLVAEYHAILTEKTAGSENEFSCVSMEGDNTMDQKTPHNNRIEKDALESNMAGMRDESIEEHDETNPNECLEIVSREGDSTIDQEPSHNNSNEKDTTESNMTCLRDELIEEHDETNPNNGLEIVLMEGDNMMEQKPSHNNQIEKDTRESNMTCMSDESIEHETNSNESLEIGNASSITVNSNSKSIISTSSSNNSKIHCQNKSENETILEKKALDSFLMHEISFELDESINCDDESNSIKKASNSINYDKEQEGTQNAVIEKTILLHEESLPELVNTFEQTHMESTIMNATNEKVDRLS